MIDESFKQQIIKSLDSLYDMSRSHAVRIEALHEHKLKQIDENKKISRRVDELEKKINEIALDIESHYEASIEDNEYADDQIRSKFKEFDKLKSKFEDFMRKSVLNCEKRPFTCPVCYGCGNDKGTRESNPNYQFMMKYASCNSCQGKGIVWG